MTICLIELLVASIQVIKSLRLKRLIVSESLSLLIGLGSQLHSDILSLLVAEDVRILI
jgi:hypothetical protein